MDFASQNHLNSYLNCLLQLHQQSQLVSAVTATAPVSAPAISITPAEKLKSLLGTSVPPAGPSPPATQSTAPSRKNYQTFRPPLVVSNERKLGNVSDSDGPIMYKEVMDPEFPNEKYIICGECDSLRLFRQLSSLFKHRQRSCVSTKDTHKPDVPETTITHVMSQARLFLESQPLNDLVEEGMKLGITSTLSKPELIDAIIAVITAGDEQPAMVCVTDSTPNENETQVPTHADIPPLPELRSNLEHLFLDYSKRADKIRKAFPDISSEFLLLALVSGTFPNLPNKKSMSENKQETRKKDAKKPTIPSKSSQERVKVRKSKRIAKLNSW